MKKRVLLFTAVAGMSYLLFSSYAGGPAGSFQNRCGAKGSTTTCGAAGCHGTAAGPTVTITVDSGTTTVPVTKYVPGGLYTIKLHGAGTTNTKFGFQFASVSGSGAAQAQAGTASALPSGVASHTFSTLNFIEQTGALTAASAGVYDVTFQWTAPATGVGTITLYCTINSVNGDASANSGDLSGNTSVTLGQHAVTTGVAAVTIANDVTAYPNPVMNNLTLAAGNAGTYSVQVFDMNGRNLVNEQMTINGTASLNTSNWAAGFYQVVVEKDGSRQVIPVVKQ